MSTESAVADALAKLTATVDRTTRLAEQLLTIARFDSSPPTRAAAHEIHMDRLASVVVQSFAEVARARHIELDVHAQACCVMGDEDQIGGVLHNLIHNALRYTPPGGQVRVCCEPMSEDRVSISVSDSGPGIAPAEQTRVFERFYRGRDVQQAGTGLGLAIVKQVTDAHGGQIMLGPGLGLEGGGLCIKVVLPLWAAEGPSR
jgi:signal transduction histidine kinase